MLEAVIAGLAAVALGIAANILTPHVQEKLSLQRPTNPSPPVPRVAPSPDSSDEDLAAWRAKNRSKLNLFSWQVYVYGVSFFAMFAAINIPLTWVAGIGTKALDLETTRLSLNLVLQSEQFSTVSAIGAMALYIPCWYLSQKVANLITAITLRYSDVNETRYAAFVGLGMFFMALIVAGHTIFLLNPDNSYLASVVAPFLAVLVIGAFISGRR
ncbi:hypothetical protein [Marinobacter sp. HN1S83]|uniref:hypothetical protein n=1 Tax=Marinobacter sp. HN1S83 TaxID=3382301 RepID=UPI00387B699D